MLAIAVASYGVLVTTVAHAHDFAGFHQVHVLEDDHHHDHNKVGNEKDHNEQEQNGPEHSETGFHSHSSPQIGPADSATLRTTFVTLGRAAWIDPARANPLHKDRPPFKPPRISL